jgi:hypothetical protein
MGLRLLEGRAEGVASGAVRGVRAGVLKEGLTSEIEHLPGKTMPG